MDLREALLLLERTANKLIVRQDFADSKEHSDHMIELEIAADHARAALAAAVAVPLSGSPETDGSDSQAGEEP